MFGDRSQRVVSIGPFACTGAASTKVVSRAEGDMLIKSVDVFASASVATHATQYIALNLVNLGTAGTGTTVIATASTSQTGGSAIPAHKAFPLTITAANATVSDGQAIGFVRAEAHTDAADIDDCVVVVHYHPVGATS